MWNSNNSLHWKRDYNEQFSFSANKIRLHLGTLIQVLSSETEIMSISLFLIVRTSFFIFLDLSSFIFVFSVYFTHFSCKWRYFHGVIFRSETHHPFLYLEKFSIRVGEDLCYTWTFLSWCNNRFLSSRSPLIIYVWDLVFSVEKRAYQIP